MALVVIRQQPRAENGEIGVARIEDEVTVKTFKRSGGRAWLAPRNKAFAEIPADNATILGPVVPDALKVTAIEPLLS